MSNWRTCSIHGDEKPNVWGCPECLRELREEVARLRAVYEAARRVLRFNGVDKGATEIAVIDMDMAIERMKLFDAGQGDAIEEDDEITRLRSDLALAQGQRDASNREIERLRDENESLRGSLEEWKLDFNSMKAENEALASNLRGKHATTGATYSHLVAERDRLRDENAGLRKALERIGDTACGEASHQFIALQALAAMQEGK